MRTTLSWHVDPISKDVHFDGVISAHDLRDMVLAPKLKEALVTPAEWNAANLLAIVASAYKCSFKELLDASK
jgi:hypothetical protein